MANLEALADELETLFDGKCVSIDVAYREVTLTVLPEHLRSVCTQLKTHASLKFEQLIDVCGVDYLHFGQDEWVTEGASGTGFERAAQRLTTAQSPKWAGQRLAVVYHLLSVTHNRRLRLKVFINIDEPIVESVADIWPSANWAEREAYDLYGILFANHPDLRRILTDYGFVGHPMRKDFPVSGKVEVRYDATQQRVIYDRVDIEPRILVPKVIREDNRYTEKKS